MVNAYWEGCDPLSVDGEGAESFATLMTRVWNMLDELRTLRRFTRLNQRIQQEIVGTESGDGGILCVVQLLPGPPDATRDTRDGSVLDGSRLERP